MATTNSEQLRQDFDRLVEQLKTLRDEIRVDLHLAGMEARDRFNQLEPKLNELENRGRELADASVTAFREAIDKLRDFRDNLRKREDRPGA